MRIRRAIFAALTFLTSPRPCSVNQFVRGCCGTTATKRLVYAQMQKLLDLGIIISHQGVLSIVEDE